MGEISLSGGMGRSMEEMGGERVPIARVLYRVASKNVKSQKFPFLHDIHSNFGIIQQNSLNDIMRKIMKVGYGS